MRRRLHLVLAALVLAGCAPRPTPPSAAARLPGQGFTLAPPAGNGWIVGSAARDRIVFTRAASGAPAAFTAGAEVIADAALAADLPQAARAWLAGRLQAPRRDTLGLDVRPAALHDAPCVAYDAAQVDRYEPGRVRPDHVDDRFEYAQHGLLCARGAVVVQVFYNERFLRDGGARERVNDAEVRAFYEGLRWEDL